MDKDKTRVKVKEVVAKYEKLVSSNPLKKYNEEETKKDFILPLFEALGWNVFDKNEVTAEETQSGGRVDYGFYLEDRIKFYLEAKPLGADLNKEDYAHQTIRYSWNKGVTWAVLTNFERIKVFNAENISRYLADKLLFDIPYNEFIERFDQLWLLSKEAFSQNIIDKEAEKIGKKLQRVSVGVLLYKDLNECRNILTKDLSQWNDEVPRDLLDEGVQKILDRLLFIRVAEDRGIEPSTLRPLVRQWENRDDKNEVPLYMSMIDKFRELNDVYNSNLFSPHPFEKWQDYSGTTKRVIDILYGSTGYYDYDFKIIPADVLGTVYENYLGYRLSQSKKGVTINKDAKKRKEEGIYYTPNFIVDYIVKNALGPVLHNCTSVGELKKVKVLDPACGSGSFLIKALDLINKKYEEFGNRGNVYTKPTILLENIYGVDLDEQAVEIARLNLLINSLEKRVLLPSLANSIKNGNSLVSGTDEELKKYFGKGFKEVKPFNWHEQFPDVFKQGGFDVIIGNPPWVSLTGKFKSQDFSDKELEYFVKKLNANTYAPNLYEMFIWRCLTLLKPNGMFSFIVPDRLCANEQFIKLREHILKNFTIKKLLFRAEFPGVTADTVIFVIQNKKPNPDNLTEVTDYLAKKTGMIPQSLYLSQEDFSFFYVDEKILRIFTKIMANKNVKPLVGIANTTTGCGAKSSLLHEEKQNANEIKIIKGENIGRYQNRGSFWFEFKGENLTGRTRDKEKLETKYKILLRKTGSNLIATFDESGIYPEQSLYFIFGVERKTLLFLLAIINSKLIDVYYRNFAVTNRNSTPQLKNIHLDKFPIMDTEHKDNLVVLAEKMLVLNKELSAAEENSNEWEHLKSEIEKTDEKIDAEVYKLYGLTDNEIEIIEKS